jgi:hypothetical protein
MLPVAFFFAALPRGRPGALGATSRRAPKPVSGFAEAVQLGQMGRIQQSSSRVMQVRVTDLAGNVLRAPNLLLRGAAFDVYEKGRWRATQTRSAKDYRVAGNQPLVFPTPPDMEASVHQQAPLIHCDVSLEPLDTRVLFTPYPVESLTLPYNTAITVDRLHETMQTRYERRGVLRYQVVSRMAATRLPPGLRMPSPPPPAQSLWIQLPTDFPDRVRRLAERVADVGHGAPPYDRARRILEFLSDPRAFKYSLELRPIPEGEDPVEGFLFGTREGNCEYFASAMVLLLRCAGVRARMVNGYKTGEWNEFGQHVTFRQRDAHSWAEAYIPGFGWATFDPSPGEGERPLRHAEGVLEKLRSLADLVERAWIEYVVSYDEDKQGVFYHYLQRPLILVKNVLAAALWQLLGPEWLSRGRMEEMWSTIWGRTRGPVTVAASVVAAAMVIQSLRQALRWRTRRRSARVSVAFYGEMLRVLRRKGFRRRPHVTPAEFADEVLTADAEALAPVGLLTRLFCEVRYGGRDLDTDQQTEIGLALKRLRRARPRRRRSATIKAPTAP